MRVHLAAVMKDEADIVGQTLEHAAELADHVYVRDIGSTDGTLDILHDVARRYSNVIVYSEPAVEYSDLLRRSVYLKFQDRVKPGDLWGKYDSDEMFLEDPREVFREAKPWDDIFWASFFNFYMTDADIARYDSDPGLYDDTTPIQGRIRYYINNWSEPRFVRDYGKFYWKEGHDWPSYLNHCTHLRIKVAHYAFRSPKQIDARLASRWRITATSETAFPQDILPGFRERILDASSVIGSADEMIAESRRMAVENNGIPNVTWRDRVIPASDLDYYDPDQPLVERPDLMPPYTQSPSLMTRGARRVARSLASLVSNPTR